MTAKYLLVRRLPDGQIKAHATPFDTFIRAARAAGLCLYDNGQVTSRATALTYSSKLAEQPIGTIWGHPSGYDFRILRPDFTADGVMITPGLEVTENSLRAAVIDPAQFFDESKLMPGGEFFDHWYYVIREGEDRPYVRFDSARLTTSWNG